VERADKAAEWQGNGLDHGHEGVEDVDKKNVDATRAIGARASGAHGGSHCCAAPECGEMEKCLSGGRC
jgi:hypothetical protein